MSVLEVPKPKRKAVPVPAYVTAWFAGRGWRLHPYQRQMIERFRARQSTLLIAPTGGGKTLSGFLPSLIDIHERRVTGLHTLYISPLKALANDIERNLHRPIAEMGLAVSVESRTGDTPAAKRARQRQRPPGILLTTPESLMLMLSHGDARKTFGGLRAVIVDEVHSFAHTKRGDFTCLALARLRAIAPDHIRIGLSATAARPDRLAHWLGGAEVLASGLKQRPLIETMRAAATMPYGGYMARYAMPDIYQAIKAARTTIVFTNTRAQAEMITQLLWEVNEDSLPITVYHGSLTREQRRRTERMMAEGHLRAVVATSALELGIDWGDVDRVIQVGAPKGVSRLLQRIGRSNHRLGVPSEALLVPSNRFESLECEAAMEAIAAGHLDGDEPHAGAEDVVIQFIVNCACAAPFSPEALLTQVRDAAPYARLSDERFARLLAFAEDGGYVLRAYDRYKRLVRGPLGITVASEAVRRRHRQNIGVIVEAARLKVRKVDKAGRPGRVLGEVEEYFASGLTPGDTFVFAGEVLAFVGVNGLDLEVRPAKSKEPKIPSYSGGQMPLSTFLAEGVRRVLADPAGWANLPAEAAEWLGLQRQFSVIPPADRLLIEHFPRRRLFYTCLYTFEGRRANQTLGLLLTRRMEREGIKPISFTLTDYGLAVASVEQVTEAEMAALIAPDILADDLEEWIMESPMLKRSFRHVATVAGLAEQRSAQQRRTMKQMTVSTDLIFDVLMRHEPDHILLSVARTDAERELLDIGRLSDMLARYAGKWLWQPLDRASPLSVPVLTEVRTEQVKGAGIEALLVQRLVDEDAEEMIADVRAALG